MVLTRTSRIIPRYWKDGWEYSAPSFVLTQRESYRNKLKAHPPDFALKMRKNCVFHTSGRVQEEDSAAWQAAKKKAIELQAKKKLQAKKEDDERRDRRRKEDRDRREKEERARKAKEDQMKK